jgi:F0F1-type ATP synthase membrane subunit b/b'
LVLKLLGGLTIKDTHTFMMRVGLITKYNMSKWIDRIIDEVHDKLDRHFNEYDEKVKFLSELTEELEYVLEQLKEEYEKI